MQLKELILNHYRNYPSLHIRFHRENNLLIGENGEGKTNILESIYLLGMMKSFRGVLDKDLIRQGSDYYFVKGIFETESGESSISIGYQANQKNVQYNSNRVHKISTLVGGLKVVALTQHDIELIIGAPSIRRRFLDMTLSLSNREYFELLQNYRKIVKQRNSVLKRISGRQSWDELKVWDEQLIETGSSIILMRKEFFDPINDITTKLYNQLSFDIKDFTLSYYSSIGDISNNIRDSFKKKLSDQRDKEILYKQSLFGPHKDDITIRSGKKDFKRFASQGQNRAGSLTLKLAMTQYIENMTHEKMVLLLDDVLLDLDMKKRERFIELLTGRQNIYTSTSINHLNLVGNNSYLFQVKDNQVIQE